jgi:lipopolysaccharide/colanic/teichoic acid biosynthesis glycosyltransferase
MLALERRRAERSRKPFVLILIDAEAACQGKEGRPFFDQMASAVLSATRETDLVGWYKQQAILGVIFTEIGVEDKKPVTQILLAKVVKSLHNCVDRRIASKVIITAHLFPESFDREGTEREVDVQLYPDLKPTDKKTSLIAKRVMDLAGSSLFLLLLSPLLAVIALAIKLTSEGPVLFGQERLGQFGTRFRCLKFRTMYTNNNSNIHKEYVERFISGKESAQNGEAGSVVYKITNDPRVTPVGRILRRLSLDEIPQFLNVLRGEMSLVGPRPPLPYEFKIYDLWHKRRVLELKPGVTGLWQVSGRSRTSFDDMVRLDLRYSQSWSLWLDVKILAATPRAVFTGDGAY